MAPDRRDPGPALVSIAIPTFNRAHVIERALCSALEQTHRHLEIVISDNASSDATPQLCAAIAARDDRVRVLRRPRNSGPIANFNAAVAACRGDFILLLADDDWLAPDYVERCLLALHARPELALTCGRARYYLGDAFVEEAVAVRLSDPDPARRVARYFDAVGENATFYGLLRGDVAHSVFPMANVLGADWLLMADVAWWGGIETLGDTTLSRSLGGASVSMESVAKMTGQSSAQGRHAHLSIARSVMRHIGWHAPLYAPLGRFGRLTLALRCQPPLLRHWRIERYRRLLAHPLTRRVRPVTRLRALRARAGGLRSHR